jgi:hypothetical protein
MNTGHEANAKLRLTFDAIDRVMLPIARSKATRTCATASTLASVGPARKMVAPLRAKAQATAPPTLPVRRQ